MIDLRPAPPPFGSPGYMLVKNFDAITTRSRFPVRGEVVAEDRLGVAVRVDVRGVDEVAAAIEVGDRISSDSATDDPRRRDLPRRSSRRGERADPQT